MHSKHEEYVLTQEFSQRSRITTNSHKNYETHNSHKMQKFYENYAERIPFNADFGGIKALVRIYKEEYTRPTEPEHQFEQPVVLRSIGAVFSLFWLNIGKFHCVTDI